MRLTVVAVGHARGSHEGELCNDFIARAGKLGRRLGIAAIAVDEVDSSRARDAATRLRDESERLAARLPAGARVILLDAKGRAMTSAGFAEMLAALRDAGTRELAS